MPCNTEKKIFINAGMKTPFFPIPQNKNKAKKASILLLGLILPLVPCNIAIDWREGRDNLAYFAFYAYDSTFVSRKNKHVLEKYA